MSSIHMGNPTRSPIQSRLPLGDDLSLSSHPPFRMSSPSPHRARRVHSEHSNTGANENEELQHNIAQKQYTSQWKRHTRTLSQPSSPTQTRFRLRRALRSPRRILFGVVLFAAVTVVLHLLDGNSEMAGSEPAPVPIPGLRWLLSPSAQQLDPSLCRFVSPVEAYHHDLRRLRALYPSSDLESLMLPSNLTLREHAHVHQHQHHHYSSTGHLIVSDSPVAPHPIPLLLSLGEKRWEELLSRQSRTLGEAVNEYNRRYGRPPPKGFDIWWDFAIRNKVVLPDEYDRINLDLAPFWALPKDEMKKRMDWVEEMPEVFILNIKDGEVHIEIKDQGGLKWGGTWHRALDAQSLLRSFSRYLPDLRATFSIFDQPQIYLSWARRSSLVDLGLRGEHTSHLKETDDAHVRLSRSCSPDSNFRINASMEEGRSFVYDSLEAGDFCENPYLVPLHGLTLERHEPNSHPRPHTQLLPLFSLAKTSINSDILITPLEQFFDKKGTDPDWERKKDSRLAWRGSPTGMSMMTHQNLWRQSHRVRLHHFANNFSSADMTFLVPDLGQDNDAEDEFSRQAIAEEEAVHHRGRGGSTPTPLRFKEESATVKEAHKFFFDIQLAGGPIQCSEEDGTCNDMRNEIEWASRQSPRELNKHKFLLDIDGNGWSARFRRLLSTNSVVIKAGIFTEWFQPHLIPWFMFIPAKLDFTDLADIMAFFRGTPNHPELAFDETAKALGRNGQCFVQRMFRIEDLQAYMMRLFLEYSRLAADEGVDMDFFYDDEDDEGILEGDEESTAGEEPPVDPVESVRTKSSETGPVEHVAHVAPDYDVSENGIDSNSLVSDVNWADDEPEEIGASDSNSESVSFEDAISSLGYMGNKDNVEEDESNRSDTEISDDDVEDMSDEAI